MLDVVHPYGRKIPPFVSRDVETREALAPWELAEYFALRLRTFRDEQGLFTDTDRDETDERALAIVAVSRVAGMTDSVVGAVRIYETEPGIWFGGRLAVEEGYRRLGSVGGALIDVAVRTAHGLGARRFFATVQAANVRYFERYRFIRVEPVTLRGAPHELMEAELAAYPPRALGAPPVRRAA